MTGLLIVSYFIVDRRCLASLMQYPARSIELTSVTSEYSVFDPASKEGVEPVYLMKCLSWQSIEDV